MPKFKSTKLWDKDWYAVDALKIMQREAPEEMKKEYQRLKNVADKRLKRLEKKYDWTKTYKNKETGFKRYSDIDPRDFAKEMHELYKFVSAGTSTLGGQVARREKTIETINKAIGAYDEEGNLIKGSTRVTKRNYQRVIQLLDTARKYKLTYDSEKIVELANLSLQLSKVEFDDVLDNLEKLVPNMDTLSEIPINELKGYSFDEVIKKVGG